MKAFYDSRIVVAGTVAALLIVALTASLGTWQLRRADARAAAQHKQDAAMAAAPVDLGSRKAADGVAGARVRLVGRFDPVRSILLDNRTRDGVAGFHVVTPMRLTASGDWVLVLRGWIARDPQDRARLPALITPTDEVALEGVAEAELAQPMLLGTVAEPGPGDRIWQHLDYPTYRRWSGLPVWSVIVRQNAEPAVADRLVREWARPGMSVERHQGYAFQWFAMTAVAVIGWIALLVHQWRRRPRT